MIHLQDCVAGMKEIPDKSAQCVIIDPPYNIGKDFGNNSMKNSVSEYIQWSDKWLSETFRIISDTGTVFIYGFSEILMHVGVHIETTYPHISVRWLVWSYTNKVVPRLNGWQRTHESILCCSLTNFSPIFNTDIVRIPYTESFLKNANGKVRKSTKGRFSSGETDTIYTAHENGALPRDVIQCPALAGGAGKKERGPYETKHPTQKPLKLTEILLKSCMVDNGLVVIPFVGSGTECVVAKQLGLPFIGFELNQEYIELAMARLADTK
jgi:site-specific DNA-methyltransferase (adenine-specific)